MQGKVNAYMSPEDVRNKRVTVIGGARSGLAAAKLLSNAGASVLLTERGAPGEGVEEALRAAGVAYEFGGHTGKALDADFMVISPGVPSTTDLVRQALRDGLKVYSEIEVACWFCKAPIVAITGSNGKTTTTSLTGFLFKHSGRNTIVAGNIGFSFSDYALEAQPSDVVVLEVSSFQLDHIETFRPKVSVLLNITPDHLDRYDYNFDNYAKSKLRIFSNQQDDDVLVYNHDDTLIREQAEKARGRGLRVLGFSQEVEVERGAFVRDGAIILRINQLEEHLMNVADLSLRGRHNLYNSLAAAIAARAMDISQMSIRESLATFEGVPHRLEFVREVNGVRFVNDSKATNVNAVWYALESFHEPIVLIAGGRDKGNDYEPLKALVENKVRAVVAIGESAETVEQELGPLAQTARASSMEDAVRKALDLAQPGDVVLLSPACASFDMFLNYEDRGDTFKRLVMSL
jgi:UDP-N-acetylmuramoylalanine--D-glutamate ligase